MVKKSAFTLIELIFAIVIIAISVMSLPMMNRVITDGISSSIIQEAIFGSATVLNEVTTAHWDENSLEPASLNSFAKVIDLGGVGGCDNNSSSSRYRLMRGHIAQPLHRRCLDSNVTAPAHASTNVNIKSLNTYEYTTAVSLFNTFDKNAEGYKNDYNSTITVTQNANFNGNNANIKKITVNVIDGSGATITSLSTYSANIGEVDFYKKEY